jgi:mono/diheme cytochrome c family protein
VVLITYLPASNTLKGINSMSKMVFFLIFMVLLVLWTLSSLRDGVALAGSVVERAKDPGEALFNTHCSKCHGPVARGTEKGPPLLHKIYEPNHHSDFSFRRAVEMGVRAHHWRFGDMPKVEGVTPEETGLIIKYIRQIQQEAGIY